MTMNQEAELMDACRILFPSAEINRKFLYYIQPEGLKNAYRDRAWEFHPDACDRDYDQIYRTDRFRRSVDAYQLLSKYLHERKPTIQLRHTHTPLTPTPRITIERAEDEQYYDDLMPTIELKLGLFLYYSGAISYQAVVRALMWQRDQRPPLGDFACKWGWLSEDDITTILGATHIVGSFGERAVALGLLTDSQLNIILLHQKSLQQPIGRYLVSRSILTELSLQYHLRELANHNRRVRESRSGSGRAA